MKISIVIPAFNEENRLEATIEALQLEFSKQDPNYYDYEIIIADDGSKDNTPQIIEQLKIKYNFIKSIKLIKNMGKGKALSYGVMMAEGDFIIIYDADAATPPSYIKKFISILNKENLDIIIGSRELGHRQGFNVSYSPIRRVMGRIYAFFTSFVVEGYLDTQCGFKIFRKEIAHHLFSLLRQKGYVWDVELLMLAKYFSYKVKELPIDWHHKPGSKVNILSDSLKMLFHLFQIWLRKNKLKKEEWIKDEACLVCKSQYWNVIKQHNTFKILKCFVCNLGTITPKPNSEEIKCLYDKNYFSNEQEATGYNDYLLWEKFIKKTAIKRLKLIEKYTNSIGNLLEIGCATGYFLEMALQRGWKVKGIEISQWAANIAMKKLGGNCIINSSIEKAINSLENKKYDAIVAWDVIEHLSDPQNILKKICQLLTPNGLFAITTPDSSGLLSSLTGKFWLNYRKVPEHIYFFDKNSISQLLSQLGFTIILTKSHGKHTPIGIIINRLLQIFGFNCNVLEKNKFINNIGFYCNPTDIMLVLAKVNQGDTKIN